MTLAKYSPSRIIAVTAGLSVTGAVLGGVAGATALALGMLLSDGQLARGDVELLIIPAVIGAVLGSVCAPLAGWLLLRRVPLGRAFGGLVLGTILGGLVGWFSPVSFNFFVQPIVTAATGLLVAALLMRFKHAGPAKPIESSSSHGAT